MATPVQTRIKRPNARQMAIIHAVYECRTLTSVQLQRLFFSPESPWYTPPRNPNRPAPTQRSADAGANSSCQRNLHYLADPDVGFLQRRPLPHTDEDTGYAKHKRLPRTEADKRKPLVYFLWHRGAQLLQETFDYPDGVDWDPRENNPNYAGLAHRLATNDFRISMLLSLRRHGCSLDGPWLDYRDLERLKERVVVRGREDERPLVPDGFFVIRKENNDKLYRFVEIDMDSEPALSRSRIKKRNDFGHKALTYLQYQKSGAFTERFGADSFRVFVVVPDERRKAALMKVCASLGVDQLLMFSTFDQVAKGDALDPRIWVKPATQDPLGIAS